MRFENVAINFVEIDCRDPYFVYWEGDDVYGTRLPHEEALKFYADLKAEIDECDGVAREVLYHLGVVDGAIRDILNGRTDEAIRYYVAFFVRVINESITRLNKFSPAAVWSTKDYLHMLRTLFPEVFIEDAECVAVHRLLKSVRNYEEATRTMRQNLESFIEWLGDRKDQLCSFEECYKIAYAAFVKREQCKKKSAERRARRYARKSSARKAF